MNLVRALRVTRQSRLAFVGEKGKMTAMSQLAQQIVPPVILTSTIPLSVDQRSFAQQQFVVTSPAEVWRVGNDPGICLFTGVVVKNGRAEGVNEATLHEIKKFADEINGPLLILGGGFPLHFSSVPSDDEILIPDYVDTVVEVVSIHDVQQPAHFCVGLNDAPARARHVIFLDQADTIERQSIARGVADRILTKCHAVGISSFTNLSSPILAMHEKVAGIVLAAGGSRRLGQPKQLLDWQGKPLVRHTTEMALEAGLSPVVVVTGASADEVGDTVRDLPVQIVNHEHWEAGQSTSVQVGLQALPSEVGGAVFLLVDQPYVSGPLVRALVEEHARTLAPIIAPLIDEQRGNPVLFDRITFSDFDNLEGDVGARALFAHYRPVWVPWHDARALQDIDTLEDYQRLVAE